MNPFGSSVPVHPSICPSTAITTSASVFASPGLFVHLYLCPTSTPLLQWKEAEE